MASEFKDGRVYSANNKDSSKPIKKVMVKKPSSIYGSGDDALYQYSNPNSILLTPQEDKFCQYLVITGKRIEALKMAGYDQFKTDSTKNAKAHRLMKRPAIRNRVKEVHAEMIAKQGISENWVLRELKRYATVKITDVLEIDGKGSVSVKSFEDLDEDVLNCIQEVHQAKDGSIRIKMVDKRQSVVDIGKHIGMFADRLKVSKDDLNVEVRDFTDEAVSQMTDEAMGKKPKELG